MTSSRAYYLSKASFLNTIALEYLEIPNGVLRLLFSLWWLPGCTNTVDCYFSRLLQSSTIQDGTSASLNTMNFPVLSESQLFFYNTCLLYYCEPLMSSQYFGRVDFDFFFCQSFSLLLGRACFQRSSLCHFS